eukprot:c29183_g1_i5 orf=546-2993(-)
MTGYATQMEVRNLSLPANNGEQPVRKRAGSSFQGNIEGCVQSVDVPSRRGCGYPCSVKGKSMSLNRDSFTRTFAPCAASYDLPSVNMTGDERKKLRIRLKRELEQVRSLYSKLEARELQLRGFSPVATLQSTCSDGHALMVEDNRSWVLETLPATRSSAAFTPPSLVLPDVGMTAVVSKPIGWHGNSQFERSAISKKPIPMASPKRSLQETVNGGDQNKRQKIDFAYNKRFAEVRRLCGTILKKLMSHKHGWVFNEPVDVAKLGLHDYFTIIKKPMDLGTIKAKLDSKKYTSPCEFAEDVRLTFANALRYNPPGHDVHAMADLLRKLFESRWRSMEQKVKNLQMVEDGIAQDVQESLSPRISQVELGKPQRLVGDSRLINVASKTELSSKKKSKQHKPKAFRPERDMTVGEKRKLVYDFENLPAEKLEQVFQIIKDKDQNLTQTENEIEIEIDCLDRDTLWQLHSIVTSYNKPEGKVPKEGRKVLDGEVNVGQVCGSVSDLTFCGTVVIDKDGGPSNCSSSGSSSSGSGSSSDSEYGRPSGSDSVAELAQSVDFGTDLLEKEPVGSDAVCVQRGSPALQIDGVDGATRKINEDKEKRTVEENKVVKSEARQAQGAVPEQLVSPGKLLRAAFLKIRFADTILKAQEKTMPICKNGRSDPVQLRKEREELEKRQREEKLRLQAEVKAAELARKKAEVEDRQKREAEREAARVALQKMEKTVEINENSEFLRDLELLRAGPEHVLISGDDEKSIVHTTDGIPSFAFQGANPLEQLGLFMKEEEEEEEHEIEPTLMQWQDNMGGDIEGDNGGEEGEIEE